MFHVVSIHALLAECDIASTRAHVTSTQFQSTHSLRSATKGRRNSHMGNLRFNPRTPCGVRLISHRIDRPSEWFQSTHSLRSATQTLILLLSTRIVSIHALLAECDRFRRPVPCPVRRFNPRTPCGVRLIYPSGDVETIMVSIHALLAECDLL